MSDWKSKPETFWKSRLSPEEYAICRQKGTEPAFSGKYYDHKEDGNYHCVACDAVLFNSSTKYDSGSGWPSFYEALKTAGDETNIETKTDLDNLMIRTEILCRSCGSHLGHVFEDGPAPTGQRYCVNSGSLSFKKKD